MAARNPVQAEYMERVSVYLPVVCSVLLGTCVGASEGAQDQVAEAERLVVAIVEILPTNWNHQRTSAGMRLRPKQLPVFVNIISAGRKIGESEDDFLRRHVVHFDYFIALEFAPKITPSRVREMIAENEAIHKKIEKIRRTETFRRSKGVPIPETPDEQRLVEEYERLVGSLNRIPAGYFGDTCVYIDATELGYARFLSKKARDECEGVKTKVAKLLTSYPSKEKSGNVD
jgi:hypothetical protein